MPKQMGTTLESPLIDIITTATSAAASPSHCISAAGMGYIAFEK